MQPDAAPHDYLVHRTGQRHPARVHARAKPVGSKRVQAGLANGLGLRAARHYRRRQIHPTRTPQQETRMIKLTTTALALVLVGASAPAFAQYGSAPPSGSSQPQSNAAPAKGAEIRPSDQAMKAMIELQAAVKSNDAAKIAEKVAAAEKVAKTKEDRYLIGQFRLQAAVASKDNVAIASAVDAVAATGLLEQAKLADIYSSLGFAFYGEKKYDLAASSLDKALAIDPRNVDALKTLGEVRVSQGRKAEAVATFQRAIQALTASGRKPEDIVYKRALGVAYEASLPVSVDLGRQWAAAYPNAESWHNSVAIYRNLMKIDPEGTLDLLRLLRAANALTGSDYTTYAGVAIDQSNFVEAQSVLEQGVAANQVNASDAEIKAAMATLKSKPRPTDADLAAAIKTAQTPTALVRIGDRYYGLGEYAKAADVYRQVLTKPGADAGMANLHLGMALARAGDKAGATVALNAVTGPRAEIAKFWLLYLQSRA
jgi:tetratricopeptide (TPR) repeat protein